MAVDSISKLRYRAEKIRRMASIRKTILSNCAYHDVNLDRQLNKETAKANYNDFEIKMVRLTRLYEHHKAEALMNDFLKMVVNDKEYQAMLKEKYPKDYEALMKIRGELYGKENTNL